MAVTRFGVSLDEELLLALDEYVEENNFSSRSRAIRHLIEKNLVEEKWKCDNIVAGAVLLVFDHGKTEIHKKSFEIQSEYRDFVLSTQGFYLKDVYKRQEYPNPNFLMVLPLIPLSFKYLRAAKFFFRFS